MVDLPSSNRFTNIMVVVDCLIKMRYIVPIDLIDAVLVAECFIKYIFKLHRLPDLIVSNYRSQFVLDF
jgi:phage gp36-like protein